MVRKGLLISVVCSALMADTKLLSDVSLKGDFFDSNKIIDKVTKIGNEKSYENYKSIISHYAKINSVNESLLAAIIKVESNFDKQAVSTTNALGLMQLKLDQSVADVYKTLYNRNDLPTKEQMFEAQFNISLGSAYINLLANKYFKDIKNPISKQYCLVAAYNAGAGTVLRTFHEDKTLAQSIVNDYEPEKVLEILSTKMASEQGRRYIQKVLDSKLEFEKLNKQESFEPNFIYVNYILK